MRVAPVPIRQYLSPQKNSILYYGHSHSFEGGSHESCNNWSNENGTKTVFFDAGQQTGRSSPFDLDACTAKIHARVVTEVTFESLSSKLAQ